MNSNVGRHSILFLALAACLTGCGGGGSGGGVRESAPMMPSAPRQPDPAPEPAPAPAAPKCLDPGMAGAAGAPACSIQYNGAQDNLLVPVQADHAHVEGFTGKGVRVGVLDDTRVPGYAPLEGAIAWERSYLDADAPPVSNAGHGTLSATGVAGRPTPGFTGGVAPDARLYYGAVCDATGCHADLASRAIRDMGAAGVRIFNASYGNSSPDGLDEDAARRTAFWYRPLVQIDGLLVSSAGNGYGQEPAVMGGMPIVDPDFIGRTIIAVAGEVDADGQVTRLANYSNVCGFAAQWCITAPGLLRQPALEGTRYQTGSRGTSNAAPIVAGAAALVQQAYPWMSARNLQQTLLTTATDLGAPGVDAVFGWGLLNAHKAVHGPARFQGADFVADVPGGRAVFFNDIGGDRGLVKRGAGTLELVGANTYAGETVVRGGELVAMSGFGGPVSVHGAATLTAAGRIRGDFDAQRGAVTGITIGRPLAVDGVATLAGTLRLLAPAAGRAIGSTESLLSAASVRGAFDAVRYGSGFFYDARLSYTSTEVSATLTRASASVMSLQSLSPERVVEGARQADALFGLVDALPNDQDAPLAAAAERLAAASTVDEAELALASLTGEVHGTARAAAMSLAVNEAQLFGDRVATLDADDAGAWTQATLLDAGFERDGFASADVRHIGLAVGLDRDFGGSLVGGAIDSGRGRGTLDALGGHYDSDRLGASSMAARLFRPAIWAAAWGSHDTRSRPGAQCCSTAHCRMSTAAIRTMCGRPGSRPVGPIAPSHRSLPVASSAIARARCTSRAGRA